MTRLTTVDAQARRLALLLLLVAAAVSASYCERAKSTSTQANVPAPAPQANKQAFEMRLGFDAEGHELSRTCVVIVPQPDVAKYKVAEEKPIACPASVVVTVGTKEDPAGLFQ